MRSKFSDSESHSKRLALSGLLSITLALASCSDPEVAKLDITTSSGLPILGATVTLKGANGESLEAVDTAEAGGVSFTRSIVLGRLGSGPYLVKSAGGKINGQTTTATYLSIASDSAGAVNVTPITHMITTEALGAADTNAATQVFASGFNATKAASLSTTKLAEVKAKVGTALKALNPDIDITKYDPLSAKFVPGDDIDSQLDRLNVSLAIRGESLDTVAKKFVTADGKAPDIPPARPFKRLFTFGDSLTDGGTYTLWGASLASGRTDLIDPSWFMTSLINAWTWGGKFTTNPGPVWPEALGQAMGYKIMPALLMGGGQENIPLAVMGCGTCTNYAQGGARVVDQPGIGNAGTIDPITKKPDATNFDPNRTFVAASTLPVSDQISSHLAFHQVLLNTKGGYPDPDNPAGKITSPFLPDDLVIVLAGANDIFVQMGLIAKIGPQAVGAAIQSVAVSLLGEVARLVQNGARKIVVVGLPDMGQTPDGQALGAEGAAALTQFSVGVFNAVLAEGLKNNPYAKYLDPNPWLSSQIKGSAAATGLTGKFNVACAANPKVAAAVSASAALSSLYCSQPNATKSNAGTLVSPRAAETFIFADGVHPTSRAHLGFAQIIGQFVREKFAPAL